MKIAKSIIDGISGADWFSIIGLVLFFVFFTLMLIYVVKMKKNKAGELANIPLDDSTFQNENNTTENVNS